MAERAAFTNDAGGEFSCLMSETELAEAGLDDSLP